MLIAILSLAFTAVQPTPVPAPSADPAMVEDPFDIEAEPSPAVEQAPEHAPSTTRMPASGSPKQLLCRLRPELGTRLRYLRVCMTAQEWELHEHHMEQQRRDINDWGAQGGGATPR